MEDSKEKKEKISIFISIDENKKSSQHVINIEGIKIYYPYEAYPAQIDYMTKIVQTLNEGKSITALESPTGQEKHYAYYVQFLVG